MTRFGAMFFAELMVFSLAVTCLATYNAHDVRKDVFLLSRYTGREKDFSVHP